MKISMYKYLPKKTVEAILKSREHLPLLHFWKTGEDFGLKYRYIELRNFRIDRKHKCVVEDKSMNGNIIDSERVFLIETAKGYSISGLHGYSNHFELVETIKYNGLWWKNPQKWKEIAKAVSIK